MVGVREGRRRLSGPLGGFLATRWRKYAAAKIKNLSERGTHYGSTRRELPLEPLEPEARIACALIELNRDSSRS